MVDLFTPRREVDWIWTQDNQTGLKRFPAGRINEAPSTGLSDSLRSAGFRLGRLQTGTPARLDKRTINFDNLEAQHGDLVPSPFSFLNTSVDNAVSVIASAILPLPYPTLLAPAQSNRLLQDGDDPSDASVCPGQYPPKRAYPRNEKRLVRSMINSMPSESPEFRSTLLSFAGSKDPPVWS